MSHLYSLQHLWCEDVHASVDFVGDVFLRLFHKPLDLSVLRMVDHHTILGGLVHLRHLAKQRGPFHQQQFFLGFLPPKKHAKRTSGMDLLRPAMC